ncbi:MAG: 50S ribosomal protein L3 [Candidatus Yanofskybacteria bacterium RIFCSPHIGHO2_02_FULL_43_15c]|uniref:50S ribosomal protein L3 n=2 Tax=Candidatus Yanofskyibacteriota TaxID=1752733 RepID=A0A1F8H1H6_9BACT|nr:MAG: 50S ribosomal protein L3 [Candidatus Yanofskybacteria bacterium RIFCSPHIGHO2_02_FULL_43_15c]OGN30748.1 MAG: 50S ribosomal protein L3 [Candidatus Yanofskybacteria bacterium RIFCSPLOWO2_02_FULL_43_10b]
MKFILGKKLGMSQVFEEDGTVTPVTVVSAGPMKVFRIKTIEKDGYEAVQVEAQSSKRKTKKKELRGQTESKIDDVIDVSVFASGDQVKVTGISKGKGFQGAVKRHGFHGMPASHGHKHVKRHVGSIGQRFPQHTLKGMRMAGRMGGERVTVRGLKIIKVDKENNLLAVKGAVPGRKGAWLEIRSQ